MALSPTERKGLLMMAGRTQRELAREVEVSEGLVSMVINDKHRNEAIEVALARMLARPRFEVFQPPRSGAAA